MDLELIKKLDYFNMYANLGFQFDGIDKFEKYTIAYHNKIKDYWYNFITDIQADTKEEFDKIILEATPKMKAKDREVTIAVLPFMQEIYNNRDTYFDDDYELASNEVWQIYDDLDNINNINTNCLLNVKLEKTTNMQLYSEEMIKAYQTGDADDPYGDLDSIYKEVYENHKKIKNEYTEEFFFAKYKGNYEGFIGDISDSRFVKEVINKISNLGNIRILINNAGEPSFKLPTKYEKEDIDKCFKGLQGMILFSTETLKVKEEKDLKIVNIMSSAALRGNKQEAVYCATKWGERGYTESLKVAYKGTSVKVIGVYPGGINTEFYKNSRDYVSVEKSNSFMKPEDVAKTIINNVITDTNLTVADIIIERN